MNEWELEQAIYQRLCSHCPNAKYCHEECENCDEYEQTLARELESNEKKTQEI